MFLFFCWKLLVFFHFGFSGCGWELKVVVRCEVVKQNTKKTSRCDLFLGRTRYCNLWINVAAYSSFRHNLENRRWFSTNKLSNLLSSDISKLTHLQCLLERKNVAYSVPDSMFYSQLDLSMLFLFCCYFFWLFGERNLIVSHLDHHL